MDKVPDYRKLKLESAGTAKVATNFRVTDRKDQEFKCLTLSEGDKVTIVGSTGDNCLGYKAAGYDGWGYFPMSILEHDKYLSFQSTSSTHLLIPSVLDPFQNYL
jgi:hypothetical protein